jgi:hypothetical protein
MWNFYLKVGKINHQVWSNHDGTDQGIHSEIRKIINYIWNKEELIEQWNKSIIVYI